jgi:PAS domain S-box-containing protein
MKNEQTVIRVNDVQYSDALETAISESREMFKAIFDAATEGIVCFEVPTKRIVLINKQFCKMTGYEKNELYGMYAGELHPKASASSLLEDIRKNINTESAPEKITLIRKDKQIVYCEVRGVGINLSGHKLWVAFF